MRDSIKAVLKLKKIFKLRFLLASTSGRNIDISI